MKASVTRNILSSGLAILLSVSATAIRAEPSAEIQAILREYQETVEGSPFLQDGIYRFDLYHMPSGEISPVTYYRQGRRWATELVRQKSMASGQSYPVIYRTVFQDETLSKLEIHRFPDRDPPLQYRLKERKEQSRQLSSLYFARGLYSGTFMDGRTMKLYKPLWEVAAADPNVCLDEQTEWIDDTPCRVLRFSMCVENANGESWNAEIADFALWLDPQLGYQPRRIESTLVRGSRRRSKPAGPWRGMAIPLTDTITYRVLHTERFGEREYPVVAETIVETLLAVTGSEEMRTLFHHEQVHRYQPNLKPSDSDYGDIFSMEPRGAVRMAN